MSWAIEEKGYSQHRACALVGMAPRVYHYQSTRPDDADLRQRLRELSSERRRFGYRRLHLSLRLEGWHVNWKKLYRIYNEERLTARKRWSRKRALGTRVPMAVSLKANQRWSLDFISDALVDGRRIRNEYLNENLFRSLRHARQIIKSGAATTICIGPIPASTASHRTSLQPGSKRPQRKLG